MLHTALGFGKEFDHIRQIAVALGQRAVGLGDDCAMVPDGDGRLIVSTDVAVEGVHFERAWLTEHEIGFRAASAALSDIAGSGGAAQALLVVLVVPADVPERHVIALMEGVGAAAEGGQARVIGGDLSRGPVWMVAVTVLGRTPREVKRGGARPGDRLWVTGGLGGARAALVQLQSGHTPQQEHRVRFAAPTPRLAEGQWLGSRGATAMIDVSDGLLGDCRHLAAASQVGLAIDESTVPLDPGIEKIASAVGLTSARFAAEGGEDYELLVTLPSTFSSQDADRFQQDTGTALTWIGEVTRNAGQVLVDGIDLPTMGFDHFA